MILKRRTKRDHFRHSHRLFWVLLRRTLPQWVKPFLIVKPDTVLWDWPSSLSNRCLPDFRPDTYLGRLWMALHHITYIAGRRERAGLVLRP